MTMLRQLAAAVIETLPAQSGTLYAALMGQGCTLAQYKEILDALTETGLIRQDGQLIDSTPQGKSFLLLASKG